MISSPGIIYLASLLPKVLAIPLGVAALREAAISYGCGHLVPSLIRSNGGIALLSLSLLLGMGIAKDNWSTYVRSREARRLGAIEFPRLKGRFPGNIDILWKLITGWEAEYPGHPFLRFRAMHGTTFNLRFLWEDAFWTSNPLLIKAVLATEFGNFEKGQKFQHCMGSVLGTGVFNSDGDMWKFHRNMTRPFFNRDRISDLDIFDRHATEVIRQMKERFANNTPLDFQELLSHFTLGSATEFLFGKSIHSLTAPLAFPNQPHTPDTINEFSESFAAVQAWISFRFRVGRIWPLFEIRRDRTAKDMSVINAFINPILDDALKTERMRKEALEEKKRNMEKLPSPTEDGLPEEMQTLLGHLVSMTDDKKVIRDELLNILIAGRDTTAAGLTFITYFLSIHPEVLLRLRQEILQVVGKDDRPTLEQIKSMKYIRAVINETLRLMPPVPFNVKRSIHSTTWTNPNTGERYYIPPDTNIAWSVITMQRDPTLWGSDADNFDPDRWLDERNKKYFLTNPFMFIPFHAGPRICLGQQFALNEMSFFLIRMLQNFDQIELAADAQPDWSKPPAAWKHDTGRKAYEKICPRAHLTSYSKGGLWVRMRSAANHLGV